MDQRRVLSLIEDVYAAAERPELWPIFLDKLSTALKSKMTVLLHQDTRDRRGSVASAARIDPAAIELYESHFAAKNVFFTSTRSPVLTGALVTDADVDERVLLNSEYYGDYLRPLDVRYSAELIVKNEHGVLSVLSTMRSKIKGPFGDREMELLRLLRPHVQRGMEIHRALCRAEVRATLNAEALDMLDVGVVVLDANGQILVSNCRAREMAATRDGFWFERGGIITAANTMNTKLRQLVGSAAQINLTLASGGTLLLERPSGKRSYRVVVSPLSGSSAAKREGIVGVIITDPDAPFRVDHVLLRTLFNLTPAEVLVATHLLNHHRVNAVAANLGISVETVRTHIKKMFSKTGTDRQADLLSMLSSAASAARET
jgi:DNA-binding CsgD family transcriptional regulator